MNKIALGTAQFGLKYGITNNEGKPDLNTVQSIFNVACTKNISSLDTAIAYGDSEQVLGSVGVSAFEIISKLPAVPEESVNNVSAWVSKQVDSSLARLGVSCLGGVLLHRPSQLLSGFGDELYRALRQQVAKGRVSRIGVSIYNPSELDSLVPYFKFDIVQAPFNILDARLVTSGWLRRLNQAGVALHVRSAFLQGLLLMDASCRPSYFDRWASLWSAWSSWLSEHQLTPLQACLRYVLHVEGIERVVLGVDNPAQLEEILAIADEGPLPDGFQVLQTNDTDLLDPSVWKLV